MARDLDASVVGSGPNGLAARVALRERSSPGGAASADESARNDQARRPAAASKRAI